MEAILNIHTPCITTWGEKQAINIHCYVPFHINSPVEQLNYCYINSSGKLKCTFFQWL